MINRVLLFRVLRNLQLELNALLLIIPAFESFIFLRIFFRFSRGR